MAMMLTTKVSQFLDLYILPFIFDASFCRKTWQICCQDAVSQMNVPMQQSHCFAAFICAKIIIAGCGSGCIGGRIDLYWDKCPTGAVRAIAQLGHLSQ
jgi:hypothetical protein